MPISTRTMKKAVATEQQFKRVPVKIVTSSGKLFHNQKLGKEPGIYKKSQEFSIVLLSVSAYEITRVGKQWHTGEAMKRLYLWACLTLS